jgi:acyl-CoA synthetase (AMP-forming)/AMP-acid ligase II
VQDAIVVGIPDSRWGERVIAVVQPRAGHAVTLDVLQEHAGTLVARYKVPRDVVVVDEVVRSPSGKPDYRWAKATAAAELDQSATRT